VPQMEGLARQTSPAARTRAMTISRIGQAIKEVVPNSRSRARDGGIIHFTGTEVSPTNEAWSSCGG
jgi:hypothetical protein